MGKRVSVIPATKGMVMTAPSVEMKKRRVAGYARVSTDREEQATSYAAQVEYYTAYIKGRADWEFVNVYTDEGISATSTAHRDGFKQMVADALAGKIDLIVTKSVSRFARNTVDSLTTVRKLKEKGIEIFFEKENIWTLDSKGELLITIMSSIAQEESRSISENTTWGWRRRFAEGKASVGYSHFLGYDKGFQINDEQAETVRLIYKLYLSGMSCNNIAKRLEELGKAAPAGGKRWHTRTVLHILTNEKYMGDALLQKSYTVDFLTKKMVKNNGEIPQYYVEGHHEGIIDEATFRLVQAEVSRRKEYRNSYSGGGLFSSRIVCGECGCFYGAKVWHSNDKYRKIIWRCNHKYRNKCVTPALTEEEIRAAFLKALNAIREDREEILANALLLKEMAADTHELETQRDTAAAELNALAERLKEAATENARVAQDQEEYRKQYEDLVMRYDKKKARYEELNQEIDDSRASAVVIGNLIRTLRKSGEAVPEFQEELWCGLVEKMTVFSRDRIEITLKGGMKLPVS